MEENLRHCWTFTPFLDFLRKLHVFLFPRRPLDLKEEYDERELLPVDPFHISPGTERTFRQRKKSDCFFCAPPQKSACQIGCFIYDAVSCAPAPKRVLRNVQLCLMPLRHRHKRVPRSDHRRERSRSSAGSAPCSSDGPVSSDISAGSDQFRPLMWSSDEFRRDPISPARIPPTTSQ